MMVSLVDKQVETASGIDAVVEFRGQKPHDVVPGRTEPGSQVLFQIEPTVIGGDSHLHGLFSALSLSVVMTRRR